MISARYLKDMLNMTQMNLKSQLMHLKGITERLNTIHEAQIVQLRNYPILIPNIKSAETKIDIDTHTITYECISQSKTFKKTKNIKTAIDNIVLWIKTIVWDDSVIEIIVNGKSIYDTRIDR